MKLRILALAAAALALSLAPAQAQSSACRFDGPRCITVTFRDTEMRDVAATFAEFAGVSIVLGEGVEGQVTAEIRNQPWNVALGAILEAYGLGAWELSPGLLKVETVERIASRAAVEPLVTRVFRLRYVPAEGVAASLQGVKSERGHIAVNKDANAIVVTDTPAVIAAMERLIGHSGQ